MKMWRCFNCGNLFDDAVIRNRQFMEPQPTQHDLVWHHIKRLARKAI